MKKRNPIAKSLRNRHLSPHIIPDKRKLLIQREANKDIKGQND
jgi:hypothetical protein